MDTNFQLPDFAKIFVASLIIFTLWFFPISDALRPLFISNFLIAYALFIIIYACVCVYYIIGKSSNGLSKDPRIYVAFILAFFLSDLFMYPYLVPKEDTVMNLPVDAQISSDIFIYKMLPTDLPQIVKYFIVYPVTLSLGFTAIALLVKRKKDFTSVVGRTIA